MRTEDHVNYRMILLSVLVCLASQADTVKIVSDVLRLGFSFCERDIEYRLAKQVFPI